MANDMRRLARSGLIRASLPSRLWAVGLFLTGLLSPWSATEAGELFPVSVEVVENGSPIAGATVTIGYFTAVTDKGGKAFFELFEGPYEMEVRRAEGATPLPAHIDVGFNTTAFEIELSRIEPATLAIEPDQPHDLALGTFADFAALAEFWEASAALAEVELGNVRVVFDRSGTFAVLAGPSELEGGAEITSLLEEARSLGFSYSFLLSRQDPGPILSTGMSLEMPTVEERLLAALRDDDTELRRGARIALGTLGPLAVPGLLKALTGSDYRTDLGILVALSAIEGWRAEPDELSRLWTTAWSYQDGVIRSACRDALQSMATDAKLSLLGFASTDNGIIAFQQDTGLDADGIVGRRTAKALDDQVAATLARSGGTPWAGFKVAVYGLDVNDDLFARAQSTLRRNGAELLRGTVLKERPAWLARKSTVLYYSGRSERDARQLAEALEKELGQTFAVHRGAGTGVPKGEERWSFRVHLLGESG